MPSILPSRFIIILILGALTTISPFTIDMYLPAFPQIATDLKSSTAEISLSLSSYFIGLACGQILYGPLLDRFGRKKPLYFGFFIYLLASIACINASSSQELILFRLFQALGSCAASVAAMAMVRDFFPVEESAKIFSLLTLVLSLSPLLAPTVGGFISLWLGWKWIFILLMVIASVISLLIMTCLPEAYTPDRTLSLRPKPILKNFAQILIEPRFFTYAISGAFSFSGLIIYITGSPIIFMEIFQVSAQIYGLIFAILCIGFISGSQMNILLVRHYPSQTIFKVALIMQTLLGILFLIGCYYNWYGLYATVLMFFIYLTALSFTYANAAALALTPFDKNIGSAAALIGFLQIGIAALASVGIGLLKTQSSLPIIALLSSTGLIGLLTLTIGQKIIARKHYK